MVYFENNTLMDLDFKYVAFNNVIIIKDITIKMYKNMY